MDDDKSPQKDLTVSKEINDNLTEITGLETINFTLLACFRTLTDCRQPYYLRVIFWSIVLLTISPFDLCPDFMAYIGYIDDSIIILLGSILLKVSLEKEIIEEYYQKSAAANSHRFGDKAGCLLIIMLWILITYLTSELFIILY